MKYLILDIDGTIWNTTDVVAKAWNRAVNDLAKDVLPDLVITGDRLKSEFGKPMDVIADNLFGPISPDLKNKLLETCCEYEHEEILDCTDNLTYDGVVDTIRSMIQDNKCKFLIVSNCQDGYIELVIEKNGLEGLIVDYECFGRTGLQKDENIKLVLERNNIDSEDAFYVGDILGDYIATKKAGLKFIHAAYGFGQAPDADYVINNFAELNEII